MHLTPKEQERLIIFTAAEMARRRKAKGIKLNYPEAVAYISDEIQEKAREGTTIVAELIQYGAQLLGKDDVMEGVDFAEGDVEINAGRRTVEIIVRNTGDRPIQVGSHFHFMEVNRHLAFDRREAFGMHLDIPSGTAVRFEPGEEKRVTLTEYAGKQVAFGFNSLTNGSVRSEAVRARAIQNAEASGFRFEKGE